MRPLKILWRDLEDSNGIIVREKSRIFGEKSKNVLNDEREKISNCTIKHDQCLTDYQHAQPAPQLLRDGSRPASVHQKQKNSRLYQVHDDDAAFYRHDEPPHLHPAARRLELNFAHVTQIVHIEHGGGSCEAKRLSRCWHPADR